jgi:hypothetical protein
MTPKNDRSGILIFTFYTLLVHSCLLAPLPGAEEIKSDSSAIVILDENEMIIKSPQKAVFKKHCIIQVNSPEGERFGQVTIYENKFSEINAIHGFIKNLNSEVLEKLNKKDIKESTLIPGYVLYQDSKRTYFKLDYSTFPYLLEYDYEIEYSSLFFWPNWFPQDDVPVMKSVYKLVLQKPVEYKYYPIGLDLKPEQKSEDGYQVLVWQLDTLKARIEEDLMPVENNIQIALLFNPLNFKIDNYSGSTASWNTIARWCSDLWAGKYDLHPAAIKTVDSIAASCSNQNEIIENLYSFLQNKTRYVAISLGIGGWQPHSAASVYDNCFGDCKDLSTLMVAMLRQAGIEAYPAIILTRDQGRVIKDFPDTRFNHAITCIPSETDTIWLETTADHLSAGETVWEIEGCDVLLVKDDQHDLITTFQSKSTDNAWTSKIEGRLPSTGILNCTAEIDLTGNEKHDMMSAYTNMKPTEFKEWFNKIIGRYSVNPDISNLQVHQRKIAEQTHLHLLFSGDFHNAGIFTGSRVLINPNILNQRSVVLLPENKPRKFPLEFDYPYVWLDSVAMQLPFGYKLEAGPKPCDLQTAYAAYQTNYSFQEGIFKYTRRYELKVKTIPVELYNGYVDFVKQVAHNDQTKFVFKKN